MAKNLSAITRKITQQEPRPITDYRKDLPEGLTYALKRSLKKDPNKRYASALDLAADFAVIFEGLDTVSTDDELRDKFQTIRNLGFFKDFTDSDIWELMRACSWQNYPPGSKVIREGESDHCFYIVLSGVVGIEKNGHQLDNLQEGHCFGEMGYLARAHRSDAAGDTEELRGASRLHAQVVLRWRCGGNRRHHRLAQSASQHMLPARP